MSKPVGVTLREKHYSKGDWYIFVNGCNESGFGKGKRKAIKAKDYTQALDLEYKFKKMLSEGLNPFENLNKTSDTQLKDFAELWFLEYAVKKIHQSTLMEYREVMNNHVYPVFGSLPIDCIRYKDIEKFIIKKQDENYSRSTIKNILAPLSGVFKYAIRHGLISVNPVYNQEIMDNKEMKSRKNSDHQVWNETEVMIFLETAKRVCPELWAFFNTAINTGCRLGELLALKRENFNFTIKKLRIEKSISRGIEKEPKTGKKRVIEISDNFIEDMRSYFGEMSIQSMQSDKQLETAFCDKDGNRLSENSIRHWFKKCIRKSGVSKIRFHDIRHTYASMLLKNGADPAYVAKQLGHSSLRMVYEVYGHYMDNAKMAQINRFLSLKQG